MGIGFAAANFRLEPIVSFIDNFVRWLRDWPELVILLGDFFRHHVLTLVHTKNGSPRRERGREALRDGELVL